MKAVLCDQYGGPEVLEVAADLSQPQVGPNGVLVRVHAASVNPVDWKYRRGWLHAVRPVKFPVIWGCDLSGEVVEVGPAVTLFKPGDPVYGFKDGYVGKTYRGSYAEYVVAPEKTLARKPAALTHEEAASIPLAALTAWQALLHQGRLKAGQRVLIHAGAGGVGVMAIQIAKAFDAYVAATAGPGNQDLLRRLGADQPIDYKKEDLAAAGQKFDLVLDGVGRSVWPASLRVLRAGGRLVTLTVPIPEAPAGKFRFFSTAVTGLTGTFLRGLFAGKRLFITRAEPRGGELEKISALIEAGKVRPVLDRIFPLEQIAEAHRLSEAGHVRGKLAIKISD
jgi:NADPH:quinone reductase-like Zn-dependent oxidoreductase